MKPEFIKPIPKYLLEMIKKLDFERYPNQKGHCRFYSYLTKIKGELVKVTVAAKSRGKKWYHKQVAVHGTKSEHCLVKDMKFHSMGGYSVGWWAEGMYREPYWYEDGEWGDADFKHLNPPSLLLNKEFVCKFPQYKYSAHQLFRGDCIIKYLRLYEKYPQTEYLIKFGLPGLHDKTTILKLIAKDKSFCKWLIKHQNEITYLTYAGVIIESYKTGKPMKVIQEFAERKKRFERESDMQPIRGLFRKDPERFFSYIDGQKRNPRSYLDYLNACNFLGLDMTIPKNRYPRDFKKWHDIRIDQYHTAKAKADKKQRAELYQQFAAVAKKYLTLQNCKQGVYAVFIARSPAELVREGARLDHCVGRMDYEQKMVREETLIFFIRSIERPDVPFVTVEYSLTSKKVLQCYGQESKRPDEPVMDFVNKVWLPYANRTIKKLTQAA